jgi:hypothetical protein
VTNVEAICGASPRMHGLSLGPADLAASRGMKTTRVGGGHPGYGVLADPEEGHEQRAFFQQDLWHYTVARMVDAAVAHGLRSFYGPFGDLKDEAACEAQFRNAFLMGCSGAWSLAPNQIAIAKRVFSPDVKEVLFAKRILEAMPDGSGVATIDGKMQDDATWKQAKVIVDLARLVARRDPGAGGSLWPVDSSTKPQGERRMSEKPDWVISLRTSSSARRSAHATPRTITEGDVALYTALTGSRFATTSADTFAHSLGFPRAPVDDLLAFNMVFGRPCRTSRSMPSPTSATRPAASATRSIRAIRSPPIRR